MKYAALYKGEDRWISLDSERELGAKKEVTRLARAINRLDDWTVLAVIHDMPGGRLFEPLAVRDSFGWRAIPRY